VTYVINNLWDKLEFMSKRLGLSDDEHDALIDASTDCKMRIPSLTYVPQPHGGQDGLSEIKALINFVKKYDPVTLDASGEDDDVFVVYAGTPDDVINAHRAWVIRTFYVEKYIKRKTT